MWEIVMLIALAGTVVGMFDACTTAPTAPTAEIKKCEGTSSQRLREMKNQRYEVSKCKL